MDERAAVRNVIDGAALALAPTFLETAIGSDDVLVAVPAEGGVVLGAIVLDGSVIRAIAVRRRRRNQGLGTALVETAAAQREQLIATFDSSLEPFWMELGFEVIDRDGNRVRALR
ncbi:MAG: GNAT family N-acetyltransferase [Haloarculaceae archaeon]